MCSLEAMKCFLVLIVLCIIEDGLSYQINSLGVISLISPQLTFLEGMCYNRTGSAAIYDELRQAAEDCQSMSLNVTEIAVTLTNPDPQEVFNFYNTQCHDDGVIETINECSDNIKRLLKQCLYETELLAFNKIEDIALRIYEVICDMDQDKMKHFFSVQGLECLSDNVITIGFCFLSVLPDDDEEKQDFLFQLIEGKECKVIDDVESCMMGELEVCDEKSVSHIFKLLFEFFNRSLSCKEAERENINEKVNGGGVSRTSPIILLTSFFIALLFSSD